MLGEWKNAAAGDRVLTAGEPVSSVCIAIAGTVRVRQHERDVGELKPGDVIGTAMALVGGPSPLDATFTKPARYICWPLSNIHAFIDKRPELRVTLQGLVNQDLARKLQSLASI
jgi:CRP-like cAMP-binding protein